MARKQTYDATQGLLAISSPTTSLTICPSQFLIPSPANHQGPSLSLTYHLTSKTQCIVSTPSPTPHPSKHPLLNHAVRLHTMPPTHVHGITDEPLSGSQRSSPKPLKLDGPMRTSSNLKMQRNKAGSSHLWIRTRQSSWRWMAESCVLPE